MKKVRRSLVAVPLLFVMTTAAFAGTMDSPLPSSTPPPSAAEQTCTPDSTDTTDSDAAAAMLTELAVVVSQSLPSPF